MAELTTLEEKLAEVLGLVQAAQGATETVEGMVETCACHFGMLLAIHFARKVGDALADGADSSRSFGDVLRADFDPLRLHGLGHQPSFDPRVLA